MRNPYYCPYCEQTSSRKGNVSTHIKRRHPGRYNPFPDMKQSDCNFSKPKKAEPSNFHSPQNVLSDPPPSFGNSGKFQEILQEIKHWDKMELMLLVNAINNLPNFRGHSNFF